MKMIAKVVPYSSIVGSSVTLQNESGRVVAQLAALLAPTKEDQIAIAEMVANAINVQQRALSNPAPGHGEGVPVTLLRHCATCNARWNLFPPVKIDGSDHYRCIECKAVYPGFALEPELRAHPTGEKEGRS